MNQESLTQKTINMTQPKTLNMTAYYKGIYYKPIQTENVETAEINHSRSVMWNYMMNLSMQNAVVQAAKRA